jgi:uncharacterized short protein YbdD (DUF466 family)
MRQLFRSAQVPLRQLWWALRQIVGDAAYENYLSSFRRNESQASCGTTPLSRDEFYLDSLRRRYSKISRCC